jgi:hypothetical protein
MTTQTGGLTWTSATDPKHGQVWRSHYRQHLLRAREMGGVWIIGRETDHGWALVASGHTFTQAALSARAVLS